jgi:molybdenum cofactor cytidylyltransferase
MGTESRESGPECADQPDPVAGIILAAGLSTRMGRFKLTLPWESTTVIGRVLETLTEAGLSDIVVVTGHRADEIAGALEGRAIRIAHNPGYRTGEMLASLQVGLRAMRSDTQAALLCLGDQPQMEVGTARAVLQAGRAGRWQPIVIPSYAGRAGHPILLPRRFWDAVRETTGTLRDLIRGHAKEVRYIETGTATVLADLDTPHDYDRNKR